MDEGLYNFFSSSFLYIYYDFCEFLAKSEGLRGYGMPHELIIDELGISMVPILTFFSNVLLRDCPYFFINNCK